MSPRQALWLVCLFTVLLPASCQRTEKKQPKAGPSDRSLTGVQAGVSTGEVPKTLKVKGVFAPTGRLQIKSEFAGLIQDLAVQEGQTIAQGDPLLKIEDDQLPALLEQQRAQLQEAERLQELNRLEAGSEAQAGLTEEFEEFEGPAELASWVPPESERVPVWVPPSGSWVPVPGLPQDAGGVLPRASRNYAAMSLSQDPQDAGGIWPPYWQREMVRRERLPLAERQEFSRETYNRSAMGRRTPVRSRELNRRLALAENQGLYEEVTEEAIPEEEPLITEGSASPGPTPTQWTERLQSLDQATVDRIRAEISITERQLERRSLTSPIEGLVEKVAVENETEVEPHDLLVEIIPLDPIELILKIPKDELSRLNRGQNVTVSLPKLSGKVFEGEITFIGAELDAESKKVEVRVRVANPNLQIKPGMEGIAEIAMGPTG